VVEPGIDAVALERLATPFADAPVLDWLELANRHLTGALRNEDRVDDVPRIQMVRVGARGVELLLDTTVGWAPGAFTLADDGHTWLLRSDVDRPALFATAIGELAWLPLLVPIGDDQNGTYLLHLDPGEVVSIEGPGRQSMVRSWTAALVSWPWAEQVAVTQSLDEAEALAPLYVGQVTPDERGTVFLLGDPAGLTEPARMTIAAVVPGPSVGGRHIVALADRVMLEPSGIALRPCGLSIEHEGAVQCALDERSLIPVATTDPTTDHDLDVDAAGAKAISGPVEVRLLTQTPELVGLAKRLPNDKSVRITELIAWIALQGDSGTTSAAMLEHGIAGATASKTLYNMISAARTALGTDSSGARRLVRDTSTGVYRLSAEVTVDVLRFEQMAACGIKARDPRIAAQLCDAALSLIDATPVGNGIGRYGWWASSWEARVGRLATKAARRLVEVAEEGTIDAEVARRGIERARLAAGGEEELHRVAMEFEAWAGNPDRVEREWRLACAHAEELDPGCTPSDATEALLLALRGRNARSGHAASG
jgi:DNA-binding SARP family transcriptional activator